MEMITGRKIGNLPKEMLTMLLARDKAL